MFCYTLKCVSTLVSPYSAWRFFLQLTTIGLGKLANVKELIDISSEPKSSHVFTAFLDTLPDIMDDIVKGVCSGILINKARVISILRSCPSKQIDTVDLKRIRLQGEGGGGEGLRFYWLPIYRITNSKM